MFLGYLFVMLTGIALGINVTAWYVNYLMNKKEKDNE